MEGNNARPRALGGLMFFGAMGFILGPILAALFVTADPRHTIGFTVSLFFATAAFPEGTALAQTMMGALLSFAAAPLAMVAGRILRRPVSVAT